LTALFIYSQTTDSTSEVHIELYDDSPDPDDGLTPDELLSFAWQIASGMDLKVLSKRILRLEKFIEFYNNRRFLDYLLESATYKNFCFKAQRLLGIGAN